MFYVHWLGHIYFIFREGLRSNSKSREAYGRCRNERSNALGYIAGRIQRTRKMSKKFNVCAFAGVRMCV